MRFVDTNVLLYAISPIPNDVEKRRRARNLLRERSLAISVQVLQEFYSQATRPTGVWSLSHAEAVRVVGEHERFVVQPLTLQVFNEALALRERFLIDYWDAAILAAARIAGCDTVDPEDLNDGQAYGGVRVVNPFAGA